MRRSRSGGCIGVQSEMGKGSSFTVYLPRTDAPAADAEPRTAVSRERLAPRKILVVDDSDAVRQLAKRLLEKQAHTVVHAANAKRRAGGFAPSRASTWC